jgi:uncharacterized protein YndB with AHSA1/START domain
MVQQSHPGYTIAMPSDLEVVTTREFNAPRDLVFKAFTDPKMIPNWWGPRGLTTEVDRMDLRPGGGWRFVQHDASGNEFAFHGDYREVAPPERLVSTFEWEGLPGHVIVETTIFEEIEGKTQITTTAVFQSKEDRDGMVQSGMETGVRESYERLSEILATLV